MQSMSKVFNNQANFIFGDFPDSLPECPEKLQLQEGLNRSLNGSDAKVSHRLLLMCAFINFLIFTLHRITTA